MNDNPTNEVSLIKRICASDEKAFLEIFNLYFKGVRHFVERYVHSRELAEDLAQEVFIKIWENRSRFSEVQSFKSFLYTCAKNHTLDSLKKAARSEVALGELIHSYSIGRSQTEDKLLDKEYLACFNKVLESLPERSREIFKLCREQKKSYAEVAEIMGISKNAVKNHMVYSIKQLKYTVEAELGIPLAVFWGILQS